MATTKRKFRRNPSERLHPLHTFREFLLWSLRHGGTLWSDYSISLLRNDISKQVSERLGVDLDSPAFGAAPNTSPDPYPTYDGSASSMSYEEIGREFNVTRERIRQIEKRALEKMRQAAVRLYRERNQGLPPSDQAIARFVQEAFLGF